MNNDVQIFTKNENTKKIIHITSDERSKDLEDNEFLALAMTKLPSNYNFEVIKSILRIRDIQLQLDRKAKVALQFPDGFMIFSILIADILESFANCECVILGDITYGACCIDDIGCSKLGIDFLIHYGHSCLIPITETCVKTMYVFVDIEIDIHHLIKTVEYNFNKDEYDISIMGSIQFNNSAFLLKRELVALGYVNVTIPQNKPRSMGEVLGCTSPQIQRDSSLNLEQIAIFICDGRFHMESAMIQNPDITFYQYNPFTKTLSLEYYDIQLMKDIRYEKLSMCRNAKFVGVIFGILGRQGNCEILTNILSLLNTRAINYVVILLSELNEEKLGNYEQCECFVQIACPRISIDWGSYFSKPVITPYEAYVAWGGIEWKKVYPMDYYSYDGGEWSNYYNKRKKLKK